MKHQLAYKIAAIILFFVTSAFGYQLSNDNFLSAGLDGQITLARDNFEATYYSLLEHGLFPDSYNNNMIIHSSLHPHVQREGTIILRLVEWLESQIDQNTDILLERLNELYYLEFHRFIVSIDMKKEQCAEILAWCQDLYHYAISENGIKKYPFRTSISKLFLTIHVINSSHINYDSRKETAAFMVGLIRREMITINNGLKQKIEEQVIKSFTSLLEVYAVRSPLIEKSRFRKVMLITITFAVIGFFIYKVVMPNKKKILDKLKVWAEEARDYILEPLGEGVGKGAIKGAIKQLDRPFGGTPVRTYREKINETAEDVLRAAIHGIARKKNAPGQQEEQNNEPNPDLQVIGEQILHGILIDRNDSQQINPDLVVVLSDAEKRLSNAKDALANNSWIARWIVGGKKNTNTNPNNDNVVEEENEEDE